MPSNDPKDLHPPIKYKPRRGARELSKAEIKAAADRAEARSRLADDPRRQQSQEGWDQRRRGRSKDETKARRLPADDARQHARAGRA